MLARLPSILTATVIGCLALPVSALEIRYAPGAEVVAYPVSGGGAPSGFETIILHNIGVFSSEDEPLTLWQVRIDALATEQVTQSLHLGEEQLLVHAAAWARRRDQGRLVTHEPLYQIAGILSGHPLADSLQLERGEALLVSRTPMQIGASTTSVRIVAEGLTNSGEPVRAELSLPVLRRLSANRYLFPLQGRWLIAVGPDLHGHHRWGAAQEFALDITKLGAHMHTHRGDGGRPEMYFAYGAPVRAVAEGEVVTAVDGYADADSLRRPGESDTQFEARIAGQQERLLASGFRQIIGNHVVIRHADGEYSLYAHLRAGSVRVREGQSVAAGEPIAQLGHSGNSTEPHLHFSIQDGPDPIFSRSLPVRFEDLEFWDEADGGSGVVNGGQIVEAR